MKNYQLYLFDFDYTLAKSEDAIVKCFYHVFDTNGYTGITREQITATIGMLLTDAFELLTGVHDKDVIESYRCQFVEKANSCMTEMTELYPEVLPAFERIKAAGGRIGIVSSKQRFRILETVAKYHLEDTIDLVLGCAEVERAKPDPQGILIALDEMKVSKEECIYVGDHVFDAKAAKNAGVDFAGVTQGQTSYEKLAEYPHAIIMENLSKLC